MPSKKGKVHLHEQFGFSKSVPELESKTDSISGGSDNLDVEMPVSLPLGVIAWLDNGMIIAAGGEGPTKAGKGNGFEVLRLEVNQDNTYTLHRHSWFNTGPDLMYHICSHPTYPAELVAAVSNSILVMEVSQPLQPLQPSQPLQSLQSLQNPNNKSQIDPFAFEWEWNPNSVTCDMRDPPIRRVQALPNIEQSQELDLTFDSLNVGVVSLNLDGTIIAAGGRDGILRLFRYDFVTLAADLFAQANISDLSKQNSKACASENGPIAMHRVEFCCASAASSQFVSACNRSNTCYIYDTKNQIVAQQLYDRKRRDKFEFRETCYLNDVASNVDGRGNRYEYCIVAVNDKRQPRREPYSHLYQYSIHDGFRKVGQSTLRPVTIISMKSDATSRCVVTLHQDGAVCVSNGLSLQKLYVVESENKGGFSMDLALQPFGKGVQINGEGVQNDLEDRFVIVAKSNSVLLRRLRLPMCTWYSKGESKACGCMSWNSICSVLVAFVALLVGIVLDPHKADIFVKIQISDVVSNFF